MPADEAKQEHVVKSVRKTDGGTVIELAGDIDLHRAPALHAALVDVANERPKRLILDLSQVPYMDSSGVGTLVEVFRRVTKYDGKFVLCGLNPRVKSVFEITKLDKFFTICSTCEEALQAGERGPDDKAAAGR
ncbi:MAG TPA: STAS domain-containing protein [Phycisphaerae bacterium]|nr:STAS domain-containing protein [Phycisphaerae bacterium]